MSSFDNLVNSLADDLIGNLDNADTNKFTLLIDNTEIKTVVAARLERNIDCAADAFSATIFLDPDVAKPITVKVFDECEVYLGKTLVLTGYLYCIETDFSPSGYVLTVEGCSKTADFVDSTVLPPLEYNFVTLEEVAKQLASQVDLEVKCDYATAGSNFFARATADPHDTLFNFLHKLASERGVLIMSDEKGNITLVQATKTSTPVAVLGNEKNPISNIKRKIDGHDLFKTWRVTAKNKITVMSHTKKRRKKIYKTMTQFLQQDYTDSQVPNTRQKSVKADNVTVTDLLKTCKVAQKKAYANSLAFSLPVNSWYIPGKTDQLWTPNTLVTIESKYIGLANGMDLLIRGVEYTFDNKGCTTTLSLVPPQCYNDDPLPKGLLTVTGPSAMDQALSNIGLTTLSEVGEETETLVDEEIN